MTEQTSHIKGKRILAVDDEEDILETIEDILEDAQVDRAMDYASASAKIRKRKYDLAKETLADLDELLNMLLGARDRGEPPWRLLFERLGDYFDSRFGVKWQQKDPGFWSEFNRTYEVGKGISQRLLHDERVRSKGV